MLSSWSVSAVEIGRGKRIEEVRLSFKLELTLIQATEPFSRLKGPDGAAPRAELFLVGGGGNAYGIASELVLRLKGT